MQAAAVGYDDGVQSERPIGVLGADVERCTGSRGVHPSEKGFFLPHRRRGARIEEAGGFRRRRRR